LCDPLAVRTPDLSGPEDRVIYNQDRALRRVDLQIHRHLKATARPARFFSKGISTGQTSREPLSRHARCTSAGQLIGEAVTPGFSVLATQLRQSFYVSASKAIGSAASTRAWVRSARVDLIRYSSSGQRCLRSSPRQVRLGNLWSTLGDQEHVSSAHRLQINSSDSCRPGAHPSERLPPQLRRGKFTANLGSGQPRRRHRIQFQPLDSLFQLLHLPVAYTDVEVSPAPRLMRSAVRRGCWRLHRPSIAGAAPPPASAKATASSARPGGLRSIRKNLRRWSCYTLLRADFQYNPEQNHFFGTISRNALFDTTIPDVR